MIEKLVLPYDDYLMICRILTILMNFSYRLGYKSIKWKLPTSFSASVCMS
jgi:hypothetical protein